jgi:hypothetical protein
LHGKGLGEGLTPLSGAMFSGTHEPQEPACTPLTPPPSPGRIGPWAEPRHLLNPQHAQNSDLGPLHRPSNALSFFCHLDQEDSKSA